MGSQPSNVKIHPLDNVGIALRTLTKGEQLGSVTALENVTAGHKFAVRAIRAGEPVIKYGYSIGTATLDIQAGEHVHTHNLKSSLRGELSLQASQSEPPEQLAPESNARKPRYFDGYRRPDGKVGIRNEIWIINTVGCVNHAATRIAEAASRELVRDGSPIEGVYTFNHPFGCSQLGHDHVSTQRLLAGLALHPNAAGILVLGLGCENNQLNDFIAQLGPLSEQRFRYFNAQDVADEVETGTRMVRELAEYASGFKREPIPASELILGMKCGGSDGLSGITANPLVGRVADLVAEVGGTSILTEVPEMFGAEQVLLNRAADRGVAEDTVKLVNAFRAYFERHGEPIDENPSPGNKEGGISTLAEKSLGCVQKGGTYPVRQVLDYGEQASPRLSGIALLNGPGNDGVAGSALCAAGAHMVLFTTGRGTPLGFPVPTIKIATNTPLAERKPGWIDFNAGLIADGVGSIDSLAEELFQQVLDVASGRVHTRSETCGFREIAIWKDGVTL